MRGFKDPTTTHATTTERTKDDGDEEVEHDVAPEDMPGHKVDPGCVCKKGEGWVKK